MFKKITQTQSSASMQTIDTIIGVGCEMAGDVNVSTSIKIDGTIHGNVTAKGKITIGETGKVYGNVESQELVVFGWIHGQLSVEQLQLKKSARILGDISAESLSIEPGAVYQGNIAMPVHDETGAVIDMQPAISNKEKAKERLELEQAKSAATLSK
jgi:cytoskeletal protein CcmA (bactofilin family)